MGGQSFELAGVALEQKFSRRVVFAEESLSQKVGETRGMSVLGNVLTRWSSASSSHLM